jgi:hypothetical protein
MRYPIDVLNRVSLGIAFRNDKVVYKAADTLSLNLPSNSDNWLFLRGEYVFDNCLEVMTNIRYGTRFKVFGEIHKQFPTQNKVLFDRVDFPVVQFNNKYLGVVGFDLRHYQKIYKQIIWANRIGLWRIAGHIKAYLLPRRFRQLDWCSTPAQIRPYHSGQQKQQLRFPNIGHTTARICAKCAQWR